VVEHRLRDLKAADHATRIVSDQPIGSFHQTHRGQRLGDVWRALSMGDGMSRADSIGTLSGLALWELRRRCSSVAISALPSQQC